MKYRIGDLLRRNDNNGYVPKSVDEIVITNIKNGRYVFRSNLSYEIKMFDSLTHMYRHSRDPKIIKSILNKL